MGAAIFKPHLLCPIHYTIHKQLRCFLALSKSKLLCKMFHRNRFADLTGGSIILVILSLPNVFDMPSYLDQMPILHSYKSMVLLHLQLHCLINSLNGRSPNSTCVFIQVILEALFIVFDVSAVNYSGS